MAEYNPVLVAPEGANKKKRIIGRGSSSGRGTTAGKGNKGQQSRSGGGNPYVGFEGGQMPLFRRLARRGFSNSPFRNRYFCINLAEVDSKFNAGEVVNKSSLIDKKILSKRSTVLVKILGMGELTKSLTFDVDSISSSAREKIAKSGGKILESSDGKAE